MLNIIKTFRLAHKRGRKLSRLLLMFCLLFAINAALPSAALAQIKVEPGTTVWLGEEVFFDGSDVTILGSELLPNGMIKGSYEWDFGDGYTLKNPAGGVTTTHFYMRPGTYPVTLTVTDIDGKTATDTIIIMVEGEYPKLPPASSPEMILELKFENNLDDTSASGLTAQWQNGTGSFTGGIEGQAADLTGGSYIEVLDPAGILSGMNELTISVWAKKSADDSTGYLVDNWISSIDGAYYIWLSGPQVFRVQFKTTSDSEYGSKLLQVFPPEMGNKMWHQYALTYDGTIAKLYLDGKELYSDAHTGSIVDVANNLLIGKDFNGRIDEVKIYNKALTSKELFTGFELWHADFHGRIAQYIYAQIPGGITSDLTNKIKATITGDGYSNVIYNKNNLQSEEIFLLDNSELPAGDYVLTVQLLSATDDILDEIKEKFEKPYNGIPRVGIDENNAIRVNGELFFPVNPFIEHHRNVPAWKAGGYINSLYGEGYYAEHNLDSWKYYLDVSQDNDLLMIGPAVFEGKGPVHWVRNSDINSLAEYVSETKNHPALLMWMWHDEPELGGPEYDVPSPVVRSWTYKSHKLDAQHLVATNYVGYGWTDYDEPAWRGRYEYLYNENQFGGKKTHVTDVLGIDFYPIEYEFRGETVEKLALALDKLKEENYNLLPYMSFVETANIKNDVGRGSPEVGTPPPTPEQLRMLTWLNVVHGVKGINWFQHFTPTSPENFAVMAEFVDHIANLTSIVLASETNKVVTDDANTSGNRVDTMIREDGQGNTWIFAVRLTEVNDVDNPEIDVTFTVDDLTSGMSVIEPGEFSQSILECKGDPIEARRTFSFTLSNTPIIPGTVQVAGQYTESGWNRIYLYDDGNGKLYGFPNPWALFSLQYKDMTGTVNYETGEVYVDFGVSGPGDDILILPGIDMVRATYRPVKSDRVITHTGNTFTDTFAPNAVHIYRIGANSGANPPPILQAIGDKLVDENLALIFDVNATDPNGEPITYSAQSLPTGATFLNQTFTWTPSYTQAGSYQVTFRASDGNSWDSETITITVNNVNRPPVIGAITDQSVDENSLLSFSVEASDPDGQALTYSVSGLPAGAVFGSQTLTWTPSYDQAGTFGVTFTADDGQAQDSGAITITVINVNRTPVLTAINNQSVWADDPLTFTIDATDPDGDAVTYSVGTLPTGATFTGQDFDWTPSQGQMGSYDVTFIASDGQLQDSQTVTITVDVDSLAPTVTNLSPTAGSIQVPLNNLITLDVTDAGKGIEPKSVKIKVKTNSNPNNNTVYFGDTDYYTSPYGDCRRLGTKTDYRFVYQSTNEMFYYDQTVTITVNATDLAGNVMDEYSYSFATEMHSFGQNKQVNSGLGNNDRPVTVCDSSGNIWTAWHAGSIGNRDIYIGKLAAGEENFGGTVQLTDNTNDQSNPALALDSNDKLYVVWQDNREGDWDIYVSTSVDGISWSTETRVNDPNEDNQVNPAIVIDGQSPNQAHVVWQDDRAGNQDICIATSSDGFATKTVSQITTDSFDQVEPAVTADADNTIYVVWTDGRNGSNDIYGAASNNPWTNVAIVSNANNQSSPTIAAESVGAILHLLWVDDTLGDKDIYYASSDGLPGSPLTGSSIIDDTSGADQLEPTIAVTGSTGNDLKVFACWQDWRNTDTDLYFAELSSSSGTNVFVGDGGSSTYQGEPVIGIDEYSHPYLIWADNRSTSTEIYYAGSTFVEPVALASELVTASASSSTTVGADPQAITTIDDVSVVVPAGACSYDVAITVTKIANPQAFAAPCLGGYDFGPSGIQFSQPVTITIPYSVSESNGSTLPYWYNSLTGALSQQGITGVQDIVISPTLHALSFKTTHFTAFYLLGGGAAAVLGGGGGGGCSVSAGGEGNMVEFALPYIGLVVVMAILKVRDARERKARST